MKTSLLSLLILVPLEISLSAQQLALRSDEVQVVERGPHHRVWQRVTPYVTSYQKTYLRTNSYVEIATGMHYWKDGWFESQEVIELFPDGAIARQGQHQVIFTPNLNTAGAIDLLTVDGKRFRSEVLGLAYTDAATGKSALIAEPKDCLGEISGNKVIYRDAFSGPFVADVRYTYTRGNFEQDVVIRQTPPSPADYGLDPATIRLEMWTEFVEAPTPAKTTAVLKSQPDPAVRQAMVDPDLTDDTLDFGETGIGPGGAFPLEQPADGIGELTAPVGKSWLVIDKRTFLVEKVDYTDIQQALGQLPKAAVLQRPPADKQQAKLQPRERLLVSLKPPPPRQTKAPKKPMRMAALAPAQKGFVLDYVQMTAQTNCTFKGDTTYYVSSSLNLSGTTLKQDYNHGRSGKDGRRHSISRPQQEAGCVSQGTEQTKRKWKVLP